MDAVVSDGALPHRDQIYASLFVPEGSLRAHIRGADAHSVRKVMFHVHEPTYTVSPMMYIGFRHQEGGTVPEWVHEKDWPWRDPVAIELSPGVEVTQAIKKQKILDFLTDVGLNVEEIRESWMGDEC
jgi:hypothetical protein